MRNSRSPDQWAHRHRVQHERPAFSAWPDKRTSERFAREYEQALRQRGAEAKLKAEKEKR